MRCCTNLKNGHIDCLRRSEKVKNFVEPKMQLSETNSFGILKWVDIGLGLRSQGVLHSNVLQSLQISIKNGLVNHLSSALIEVHM